MKKQKVELIKKVIAERIVSQIDFWELYEDALEQVGINFEADFDNEKSRNHYYDEVMIEVCKQIRKIYKS